MSNRVLLYLHTWTLNSTTHWAQAMICPQRKYISLLLTFFWYHCQFEDCQNFQSVLWCQPINSRHTKCSDPAEKKIVKVSRNVSTIKQKHLKRLLGHSNKLQHSNVKKCGTYFMCPYPVQRPNVLLEMP